MKNVIFFILVSQIAFAQESFHYFEDYRLANERVATKGASGYFSYESKPWSKGVVPIEFDKSISKDFRNRFMQACKVWSDVANITCRQKVSADRNFLFVTDTQGECWTDVGVGNSSGRQMFNFTHDWCWERTKLVHEIGHVLGFMHEHQRPDRDKYLKVYPENAGQFSFAYERLSFGELDKSTSYDFMSIMHYWNKAYSVNGRAIMVPRAGYEKYANTMGTSKNLTLSDKALARKVYGAKP